MMSVFYNSYKSKSDIELLEIVDNPSKFQDDAVMTAIEILGERGIELADRVREKVGAEKKIVENAIEENKNSKKNKHLSGLLLAIVSLIAGVWCITSIVVDNKSKNTSLDKINIDLDKVNITIDGVELTKTFTDTIKRKSPEVLDLQIMSNEPGLFVNGKKVSLGAHLDSLLVITGSPQRYKSITPNNSTYIFDDFGFYVKTDSNKFIKTISVYFQSGKQDISPRKTFVSRFTINSDTIRYTVKHGDLISNYKLKPYSIGKRTYFFNQQDKKVVFNFDSPDNRIVNILIEK